MLKLVFFVLAGFAAGYANSSDSTNYSLAEGMWCKSSEIKGFTGTSRDIELGSFEMWLRVSKTNGIYSLSFANRLPDNPQILTGSTEKAEVLDDGSLAFNFVDGWNNQGRFQVDLDGKAILTMIKKSEEAWNQIGRNYGEFELNRNDCVKLKLGKLR